jgi:hypothetical protein
MSSSAFNSSVVMYAMSNHLSALGLFGLWLVHADSEALLDELLASVVRHIGYLASTASDAMPCELSGEVIEILYLHSLSFARALCAQCPRDA